MATAPAASTNCFRNRCLDCRGDDCVQVHGARSEHQSGSKTVGLGALNITGCARASYPLKVPGGCKELTRPPNIYISCTAHAASPGNQMRLRHLIHTKLHAGRMAASKTWIRNSGRRHVSVAILHVMHCFDNCQSWTRGPPSFFPSVAQQP